MSLLIKVTNTRQERKLPTWGTTTTAGTLAYVSLQPAGTYTVTLPKEITYTYYARVAVSGKVVV